MKRFIILSLLFMQGAMADDLILVECTRPGITTQNQFDLAAAVITSGEKIKIATMMINTRDRGPDKEDISLDVEDITGTVKLYPAGTLGKDDITQLEFVLKDKEVAYINLVLGHPRPMSSQIRLANGMTYLAQCSQK